MPDEETAALRAAFYGRLAAVEGQARALQDAALAQLQGRRARQGAGHPFYWGAFVCVGDALSGVNATWDAHGRALASGVYLYRLQAGGQVETRRLLLLK